MFKLRKCFEYCDLPDELQEAVRQDIIDEDGKGSHISYDIVDYGTGFDPFVSIQL